MLTERILVTKQVSRYAQHLIFWVLSFFLFLYLFKIGNKPEKIDYIFTLLFHFFIIVPVYINLYLLLPQLDRKDFWKSYLPYIVAIILLFSWINLMFFKDWSVKLLPQYFFISYYNYFQITLFFITYIFVTSLLKLSKSWFEVKKLQTELYHSERQIITNEKEMLALEAKALRAQMNPHFIFNCMNSIKSLIQQKEDEKAIAYLTTFSKLIRIVFQNSDKKEISLHDEIETCKFYTQLEGMRFGNKISFHYLIDQHIDLKSVKVPALIIQPFIENAIWHGIMPKENGGTLTLTVNQEGDAVICIIDDDGIGRKLSEANKLNNDFLKHDSKGLQLTKNRLDLFNILNNRKSTIEIDDKTRPDGSVSGTRILLTFSDYF